MKPSYTATVEVSRIEQHLSGQPRLFVSGEFVMMENGERKTLVGWFASIYFSAKETSVFIGDYIQIDWKGGEPATVENRALEGYGKNSPGSTLRKLNALPACIKTILKAELAKHFFPL